MLFCYLALLAQKCNIFFCSASLWEKLEEIAPDSWDDFADLFSRQVVAAKPVKPKTESKPVKQQTVKSTHNFVLFEFSSVINNIFSF